MRAARLLGAMIGHGRREASGAVADELWSTGMEQLRAGIEERLGSSTFRRIVYAGRGLTLDAAVDEALDEARRAATRPTVAAAAPGLAPAPIE